MKKVLIYAGTTEGRQLASVLAKYPIEVVVSVATEYGEQVMAEENEKSNLCVKRGRMTAEQMLQLTKEEHFDAVVDATHPFATMVSAAIKESVEKAGLPYIRLQRHAFLDSEEEDGIFCFDSTAECAEALSKTTGNILLTTGSKELETFTRIEGVKERIIARVLSGIESISLCYAAGLEGKQIIGMQGPFSLEMNIAMIHQYKIQCLVTKESGKVGGMDEKWQAAKAAGIPLYLIRNPEKEKGLDFAETLKLVAEILGITLEEGTLNSSEEVKKKRQIVLAGIGAGSEDYFTKKVLEVIKEADLVFGAKRMLQEIKTKGERYPYYLAKDIIPVLEEKENWSKTVVLFSGDTGFYSGASKMVLALKEAFALQEEEQEYDIQILPGISSVSYLSAAAGIPWQDALLYSMHGKEEAVWKKELSLKIRSNEKTFLLTSGLTQLQNFAKFAEDMKLENMAIYVGYQLSYENEWVKELTTKEIAALSEEGLYVAILLHEGKNRTVVTHGIKDDEFIRDKVPMTKEEIREISICKLKLTEGAVLYDIGSGTGSVSVEAAGCGESIQVYAIEQNPEAVALTLQNKKKFQRDNLTVIEGMAPEAFEDLPCPTHVFIGGSKGNMWAILKKLSEKGKQENTDIRVVINAISLETIGELSMISKQFATEAFEIIQVQVNRAKKLGNYQLMQGENPVMICSFLLKNMYSKEEHK